MLRCASPSVTELPRLARACTLLSCMGAAVSVSGRCAWWRGGICHRSAKLQQDMLGAWAQLRRQYANLQCSMSVGLLLRLYEVRVRGMGARYGNCMGCLLGRLSALATSHLSFLRMLDFQPLCTPACCYVSWGSARLKTCGDGALLVLEHLGCTA